MIYEQLFHKMIVRIIRTMRSGTVQHGRRFIRFGLVGAAGVVVNTALLYLGAAVARLPAVLAAGLATELTILGNFALNDRWTFCDVRAHRSRLHRLAAYNGIALGGMVISLGMFVLLMHLLRINYLLANLGGIAVATLWNYAVNARFTWRTTMAITVSEAPEVPALDILTGKRTPR